MLQQAPYLKRLDPHLTLESKDHTTYCQINLIRLVYTYPQSARWAKVATKDAVLI